MDLAYLVPAAAALLAGFDADVTLLKKTSDSELLEAAAKYHDVFVSKTDHVASSTQPLVTQVWRAHMLHPLAYLHAKLTAGSDGGDGGRDVHKPVCVQAQGWEWAGVDLVMAVRRHQACGILVCA